MDYPFVLRHPPYGVWNQSACVPKLSSAWKNPSDAKVIASFNAVGAEARPMRRGDSVKHSVQVGFSFGLTSGVITTLGLIVGLAAGTESRMVVVGGILMIAIADAMSDALGIHVSEEAENVHTYREVWISTGATLSSKFLVAMSFLIPVLVLELRAAVTAAVAWGALTIGIVSFALARMHGKRAWPVILEHLAVAALVVGATHSLGVWLASTFP